MEGVGDDAMDIDDPMPTAPIIERKSDANWNSSNTEGDSRANGNGGFVGRDTEAMTQSSASPSKNPSIVILDDDEELLPASSAPCTVENMDVVTETDQPIEAIIDLVESRKNSRCFNINCKGESSQVLFAPDFCLSYYRVKKSKSSKEEICLDCYYQAIKAFDKLGSNLKKGKLMFEVDLPQMDETVQIDDSDEEDAPEPEAEYIDDNAFKFIAENIESVLKETMDKLDLTNHVSKERAYVFEASKKLEESTAQFTDELNMMRAKLDKIQLDLYKEFRPEIRHLKGIMILDDYSLSSTVQIRPDAFLPADTNRNKSKSSASTSSIKPVGQKSVEIPIDLPVSMMLEKPKPQYECIYYVAKENNPQGCWIKARYHGLFAAGSIYNGQVLTRTHYQLIELKQQKERVIPGNLVAYFNSCKSRLAVGSRVISMFADPNERKLRSVPYYAGVIAEHPVEANKYRYLVFYDIGYAQYVPHTSVNIVFEQSKNVWDDMPENSREFIQKYLQSQDRPMVKLATGQRVRVEYNGDWLQCSVVEVDCSLVRVHFETINRWEWIYRGSTRLSPMYREEMAATVRHTGQRTTRKLPSNEAAVVQYTRNNDYVKPTQPKQGPTPAPTRAVARKSTTRLNAQPSQPPKSVPFLPPVNVAPPINFPGPTSKIMYFTPRDQQVTVRQYKLHKCGPVCKSYITHNFTKLRGHNPLSKPLLCGWARLTVKDRGRKEIVYKAPCGRMIRDMSEVHYYLQVTKSEMTVDLFDFNHMVRCLAEFSVECTPDPKDLSKGSEHVPIPVINGFNNEVLDFCNYSTKRVPMEGVHLNLNEEFLCGCDCDDDCVDKTKCACWKLTLEGMKYIGKDVDPITVGYIYRRLQEAVITGIYECNSRCKCKSTCLNRVVQNPMSLKLQVFKTHNRGWGIRSLNDIPQGTFICIYAGTLHTEQTANEDGMQYGDEYFAELDYIETVEKFKEDYEAEVVEDEVENDEKEKTPPPPPPEEPKTRGPYRKRNSYDDGDFTPTLRIVTPPITDDGIRSRLRKRKEEDEKSQKPDGKIKQESPIVKATTIDNVTSDVDTVTISDDEDEDREVLSFNPKTKETMDEKNTKYLSVRELFGPNEKDNIYIMDAKNAGNIGRFLNHSCAPNVFVQNVFVDTHDLRFPWVAFFSSQFIRAGTELTWNYNYDIGSVPGRVLYCHCASLECKGRLL